MSDQKRNAYSWKSLNMFDSLVESLLELEADESNDVPSDEGDGERDSSADDALRRWKLSLTSSSLTWSKLERMFLMMRS